MNVKQKGSLSIVILSVSQNFVLFSKMFFKSLPPSDLCFEGLNNYLSLLFIFFIQENIGAIDIPKVVEDFLGISSDFLDIPLGEPLKITRDYICEFFLKLCHKIQFTTL